MTSPDALRRLYASRVAPELGLTEWATGPLGLQLSPAMRAICDASSGRGVRGEMAQKLFGCDLDERQAPRVVCVRAGRGSGKSSRLVASKALHAAWTVPLRNMARGEVASSMVVAPSRALAQQTFSFVRGLAEGSRLLSSAIDGEPQNERLTLRRPDGQLVRVEILSATARSSATRARTIVFAGLDECAFFRDKDYAVNDEEIFASILPRLLAGGQIWLVSTPWVKGVGLMETLMELNWGVQRDALVAHAPTRLLNPTWDPDGSIERHTRSVDPMRAEREIDAIPISTSEDAFFDAGTLERCVARGLDLPRHPAPGDRVSAGGDMGFRVDSSALAVVHRTATNVIVAELAELRPTAAEALKPSAVVDDFARRMKGHAGVRNVMLDQHHRESVAEMFAKHDLGVLDAPAGTSGIADTYVLTRTMMREGKLVLPAHDKLLAQLRAVKWRPNPGGSLSIVQERNAGGHGDLVSALVLAVWQQNGLLVEAPKPKPLQAWLDHWDKDQVVDNNERALLEQIEQDNEQEREDRAFLSDYGLS